RRASGSTAHLPGPRARKERRHPCDRFRLRCPSTPASAGTALTAALEACPAQGERRRRRSLPGRASTAATSLIMRCNARIQDTAQDTERRPFCGETAPATHCARFWTCNRRAVRASKGHGGSKAIAMRVETFSQNG